MDTVYGQAGADGRAWLGLASQTQRGRRCERPDADADADADAYADANAHVDRCP